MPVFYGAVGAPSTTSSPDGSSLPALQGKQGELIVEELGGKFYTENYRGKLFSFNVTGQTIPVITSSFVSVFTLWNPPSSGVNAEIVDTEFGLVTATTAVDVIGWYATLGAQALAGTFTTKGTALPGLIGGVAANQVQPYSAYTTSGTSTRYDIIGTFPSTAPASLSQPYKIYDGRMILIPGAQMSVAMSTTVGTAAGVDLSVRWIEKPI